ncbi:MAG TPA: hypothetical protein VND65_10650 [Candidatus Binatia bacterium]|nr:hypothetical protein [Candidatus Binatia bacterium]
MWATRQLFFNQFQSSSQFANLVFDGSLACPDIEKVEEGTVYNGGSSYTGQTAVIDDMTGQFPWSSQFSCGKLARQ